MANGSVHNRSACNAFVGYDNLHNFLVIKLIVSTAKKPNWIVMHGSGEAKSTYVLTIYDYILNSSGSVIFVSLSVFQFSDATYASASKYRKQYM
jgi:hypothetical protein